MDQVVGMALKEAEKLARPREQDDTCPNPVPF